MKIAVCLHAKMTIFIKLPRRRFITNTCSMVPIRRVQPQVTAQGHSALREKDVGLKPMCVERKKSKKKEKLKQGD